MTRSPIELFWTAKNTNLFLEYVPWDILCEDDRLFASYEDAPAENIPNQEWLNREDTGDTSAYKAGVFGKNSDQSLL